MGRIIALVPARAGSTRIKDKNIRQINGIPLIGLAVKQAIEVPEIEEVYVSTDSELYAEIAENYGATKPFIRPKEIAGNRATDYDVFTHFLNWYHDYYKELPDLVVQVRATAPVREHETISAAIQFMRMHSEFDSLRSVSKPHQTPYKMWFMDEKNELFPVMSSMIGTYDMPTQELPECFGQDGMVDIIRPNILLKYKNMAGKRIAGLLDHPKTWDIDTETDLTIASELIKECGVFELPNKSNALGGCLGIIQGRLTESEMLQSFPREWEKEFEMSRKCGYSSIEIFRDKEYNADNPLWKKELNIEVLKRVSFREGIGIRSVCDDYIQQCDWKNLTIEQYITIEDILLKASFLGATIVVFPLFEKADIFKEDNWNDFLTYIHQFGKMAQKLNLRIALEISSSIEKMVELFEQIKNANIGLCLDTGNLYAAGISASDVLAEKKLQSKIIHVHLKDRDVNGVNVIPGSGKVDFNSVFAGLYEIKYEGILIAETPRGTEPLETARKNKKYFADVIKQVLRGEK